ncbi:helix-turn-helix domain-containing protein [Lysinibacillus sp. NPDC048646]|uniref:helix-turn-helix domain-containing protein n=1 Tax=Lysinibacillus sp. NPDC048646 TaxID=3390574 RepID=UPI003CFBE3FC
MNSRIEKLRKELGLNQEKFGARLGVTKAAISRMEKGVTNVTDTMLKLICNEFQINEEWIRDGKGEMFLSQDEIFADIVVEAMRRGNEKIRDLIVEASELDELQLKTLLDFIKSINAGKQKATPSK